MKIQSPPGMRDFYPEDMRLQNWLFDAWRRAARTFGFSEYEGPIFVFLDLFTLAGQLRGSAVHIRTTSGVACAPMSHRCLQLIEPLGVGESVSVKVVYHPY